jgi:Tol biopolymer transport system component
LQKDAKQRLRDIGDARISLDETLSGAPEPVPEGAPQAAAPRWRRSLPWALFGLAVVVAAALAAALAFLHSRQKPIAAAVRLELPLPKDVTLSPAGSFALSPDGRQLAFYAAGSDGVQRLWVRSLDSLTARPLPGSEGGQGAPIFWSPDSRYIAFGAAGELKKIDLTGDPAEILCAAYGNVVGGSWNRAGVILFGSDSRNNGIMRVSADGGPASPLTTLDASRGEIAHVIPVFLSDGRHFLYNRHSSQAGSSGIYIGSLDATPQQQDKTQLLATDYGVLYVPSSGGGLGQLLFLRNGALMAQSFDARRLALVGEPVTVAERVGDYRDFGFFSASSGGTLVYRTGGGGGNLMPTWFDRQGKVLGTAGDRSFYRRPALSPDGTQAAVYLFNPQIGTSSVWLVDFSRGTETRFTFGSANAENPIWSPDGKRVLFASNTSGHYDLYQKATNGATGKELLLKSDETKFATSVSRDERFLLYYSIDPKTQRDLWVLPLEGDKKPFLFLRTAFNESDGHFSPDGQWVAYVSDESGHDEIYVRRFSPDSTAAAAGADTGGKWQVSYGGGQWPQWSKDGKELYYLTLDAKVMAVAVSTNPVFQAGAAKLLFQAPPQASGGTFGDYTVDGKRFLFLAPAKQTEQAPFNVVLNWQAGLK